MHILELDTYLSWLEGEKNGDNLSIRLSKDVLGLVTSVTPSGLSLASVQGRVGFCCRD